MIIRTLNANTENASWKIVYKGEELSSQKEIHKIEITDDNIAIVYDFANDSHGNLYVDENKNILSNINIYTVASIDDDKYIIRLSRDYGVCKKNQGETPIWSHNKKAK